MKIPLPVSKNCLYFFHDIEKTDQIQCGLTKSTFSSNLSQIHTTKGFINISKISVKEAYAKAGLTGRLTTHTMRKTGGTWLYEATGDLLLTQEALGHRSPETTRRYVPLNRQRMRVAMQNFFFTSYSDKIALLSHSEEKVISFPKRVALGR